MCAQWENAVPAATEVVEMSGARIEDEGGGTPLPASDGERHGLTHKNKTVLNWRRHGRVRTEFNETETGPRVSRTKLVIQRKYQPKWDPAANL